MLLQIKVYLFVVTCKRGSILVATTCRPDISRTLEKLSEYIEPEPEARIPQFRRPRASGKVIYIPFLHGCFDPIQRMYNEAELYG